MNEQISRILDEISIMTVEDWKAFHRAYTERFVKPVIEKMEGK